MPIAVICPGCRAQFRVNEKFAGKQGACPKCKALITVPAAEEITIHVPEEQATAGGKSKLGAPAAKPVKRRKQRVQPTVAIGIAGAVVVVLVVTWLAGDFIQHSAFLRGAVVVVVSFPLAIAAYAVLRDEELEPYRGSQLWIRAGICAAVYAAGWGVFALLPSYVLENNWNWLFVAPPFLIVGGLAAFASLDLAPESAFFHYSFYLLATIILRAAAGMPALWNLAPPTTG